MKENKLLKGESIMTRKQIDGAREVRLWIGQVIVPAVVGGIAIMSNPYSRTFVQRKVADAKDTVKKLFKKKGES